MIGIRVSEHFFSIQGEGPTVGVPAVFLRLQGCNLDCGQAGGTWTCDTSEVWKQGSKYDIKSFFESFWKCYKEPFLNGAHLIITGGEPLLQQQAIVDLINQFEQKPIIEIETNGTIIPIEPLSVLINQWNISLKLSNSGEPHARRIKKQCIDWFIEKNNTVYKFVISNQNDIDELEREFPWIKNTSIRQKYLMPAADNKSDLNIQYESVIELAKKRGYTLGQRFHIALWNQKTGI